MHFSVTFIVYQYNSGPADNGNYKHVERFSTYDDADAFWQCLVAIVDERRVMRMREGWDYIMSSADAEEELVSEWLGYYGGFIRDVQSMECHMSELIRGHVYIDPRLKEYEEEEA